TPFQGTFGGSQDAFVAKICNDQVGTPGLWALAASLPAGQERVNHTATLLANGKVLVAGGRTAGGGATLSSAYLYDPATNTWTPTGSMQVARSEATATLLPGGRVLITGGFDSSGLQDPSHELASVEIYDPTAG